MNRALFKISKPIHKIVGLSCLIYFFIMGITGILINHPSLISKISVSPVWIPPTFRFDNWNRMAMREVIFSNQDPNVLYVCGKAGVWQSRDGGRSFSALDNGFPSAMYEKDTQCMLLTQSPTLSRLYAGTRAGLFYYSMDDNTDGDRDKSPWRKHGGKWTQVHLPFSPDESITDLIQTSKNLLLFTSERCFTIVDKHNAIEKSKKGIIDNIRYLDEPPTVHLTPFAIDALPDTRAPLTRLMLRLHDGSLFGLSGKLFVDLIGVILLFLSLSAIYIWYVPWNKKRLRRLGKNTQTITNGQQKPIIRRYRFFHRYHLKFGIYVVAFLILITATGMIIKPPFRKMIMGISIPATWLTYASSGAPDHLEIRRAVYLPHDDSIVIATGKGFFRGPADLSKSFTPASIDVPVSGMGLNVLENLEENRLLIGSFKGLYIWDNSSHSAMDLNGNPLLKRNGKPSPKHPIQRAMAAALYDGKIKFWADYHRGLQMIPNGSSNQSDDASGPAKDLIQMPATLNQAQGLSLWQFLFSLHNGRLFQEWLGKYTWLVIPIGGSILLISLLTGLYDWLYRHRRV